VLVPDLNAEFRRRRIGGESSAPEGSFAPPNAFFGVYDGHGGSDSASYAAANLHLLVGADEQRWRLDPADAVLHGYALVEQELRQLYESQQDRSGSCALTVLLRGHRLIVAGLGDCRAVMVRGEPHKEPYAQLSTDQRATESSEQKRILRCGGQISDGRLWGALIPSRTLGDFPWKDKGPKDTPALSSVPQIIEYEITPDDKYLVIGSDGLWDVISNKVLAKLIGRSCSPAQKACNEIVHELKKKHSGDDTTIIVVQFCHVSSR